MRLCWRPWRRPGARTGGVREDKEPRLLASGAQVQPKGMTPDNQRGHRCDYRPFCGSGATPVWGQRYARIEYPVSVQAAYSSGYASTQEKADG